MDPSFIIIIALAFGAMWLMSSRTRKQQRAAGDFRANLEVGNEVMTGSGLFGTIVEIDGDTITLESTPGNESRWIRAAIAKLVELPPVDEDAEDAEDDDEDYLDEDEADSDLDDSDLDDSDDDVLAADADGATTDDDAIVVPDDLSSLAEPRKDDDTDKL
ncbi:preprotein translocase subunit YajC [Pengzhenrongella frigida]|uniref:Preprotein translocase subunit YajC n=1 Tax=Pengzhenrongella frigida TaxID=1259133 RepID=A0A4Q5N3W4_9MICO|nr:preprotein translocase subunit YajC [Cellulomonas sp. HLT2-17]RYV52845.1 preprotein translocase subunit YajC [Cellulomonas sp. HLT2-17]